MVGDVLCYTAYIMTLEVVTPRHPPLLLTAVQILIVRVLATVWAAPELIGQLEALSTNFSNLIPIVYLALVTAATTWLPAIAPCAGSAGTCGCARTRRSKAQCVRTGPRTGAGSRFLCSRAQYPPCIGG